MKKILLVMMMLSVALGIQANYDTKPCKLCDGLGYRRINGVKADCFRCYGSGREKTTEQDHREIDRQADEVVNFMRHYNMSPEDYAAFTNLIEQAYKQVPYYQDCKSCKTTGACSLCSDPAFASSDGFCNVCAGTRICQICQGSGRIKLGYKDNPNKDVMIEQAIRFLKSYEDNAAPNSAPSSNIDANPSSDPSTDFVSNLPVSSSSSSSSNDWMYVIGLLVLGFIVYRLIKSRGK